MSSLSLFLDQGWFLTAVWECPPQQLAITQEAIAFSPPRPEEPKRAPSLYELLAHELFKGSHSPGLPKSLFLLSPHPSPHPEGRRGEESIQQRVTAPPH